MPENLSKFVFRSGYQVFEVPEYMRDSVEEYVQLGKPTGEFLAAVIQNNLKQAVMYADENNIGQLPAYMNYFYNYAPSDCWGSAAAMKRWIEAGGLIRIRERRATG